VAGIRDIRDLGDIEVPKRAMNVCRPIDVGSHRVMLGLHEMRTL
jgi:hypothetical protein